MVYLQFCRSQKRIMDFNPFIVPRQSEPKTLAASKLINSCVYLQVSSLQTHKHTHFAIKKHFIKHNIYNLYHIPNALHFHLIHFRVLLFTYPNLHFHCFPQFFTHYLISIWHSSENIENQRLFFKLKKKLIESWEQLLTMRARTITQDLKSRPKIFKDTKFKSLKVF